MKTFYNGGEGGEYIFNTYWTRENNTQQEFSYDSINKINSWSIHSYSDIFFSCFGNLVHILSVTISQKQQNPIQ